jgi:hypothetical protein
LCVCEDSFFFFNLSFILLFHLFLSLSSGDIRKDATELPQPGYRSEIVRHEHRGVSKERIKKKIKGCVGEGP